MKMDFVEFSKMEKSFPTENSCLRRSDGLLSSGNCCAFGTGTSRDQCTFANQLNSSIEETLFYSFGGRLAGLEYDLKILDLFADQDLDHIIWVAGYTDLMFAIQSLIGQPFQFTERTYQVFEGTHPFYFWEIRREVLIDTKSFVLPSALHLLDGKAVVAGGA